MRKVLLLTIIGGGLVTAFFALMAWNIGREYARQIFAFEAGLIKETSFEHIQTSDAVAKSMQAFLHASLAIDADEFRVYSEEIIARYPFILSVTYYPRVIQRDRREFEAEQELFGTIGFQIFEYRQLQKIPATDRPLYFPVLYREPFIGTDAMLLGYDIWSNDDLRTTINAAIATGLAVPSPLRTLISEQAYDVFIATYEGKGLPTSQEARQKRVNGLISLTMDPAALFAGITLQENFAIQLENRSLSSESAQALPIFQQSASPSGGWERFLNVTFAATFTLNLSAQQFDLSITKYVPVDELELWMVAVAVIIGMAGTLATFVIFRGRVNLQQELHTRQCAEQQLQQLNKELEQRIQERTAEITRQKYILDTFMANVPDAIYFKDRESRIIRGNQAYARHFGASDPDLIIGKTDYDLFPPEQARTKYDQEQTILQTGEPMTLEEPGVQGQWNLTTKMPLRDEHGVMIGTFGISRDISTLKQVEADLVRAKEAAEAANRAKSNFLANMSHELRTPLNAILGFAQLLAHSPNLPPEERETMRIIRRSGEHLLTLINNVLDLSKIEAGRLSVNLKSFDLPHMLAELQEMFQFKAHAKHLSLTIEPLNIVPRTISTDEVKLRQVLMNLLSNAIKFTNKGGVTIRISSSQERPHETATLRFEVADTGPGIAEDDLVHLFTSFFQTRVGLEAQEGTGLGLAISDSFVRLLGGKLTVHSEVGVGTTFVCEIPVAIVSEMETFPSRIERHVKAIRGGQPRYRILVVDDQPDNRDLLLRLFTKLPMSPAKDATDGAQNVPGFDVCEAVGGQEAVTLWKTWQPHLIWMDLRMPEMNGYAATQAIRELEAQSASSSGVHTIIIALTASSFAEEQQQVLTSGFDDFLRKPFHEDALFTLLEKHLGLQFIYEDEHLSHEEETIPREFVLTQAALAALPPDLYGNLQHAVLSADRDLVRAVIARIPDDQAALARNLEDLVNQYRFDVLQPYFHPPPEIFRNS